MSDYSRKSLRAILGSEQAWQSGSPRVGDLHDLDIAAESIQCRTPAVRCGCGTELVARSSMRRRRRLAEGAPRLSMQQVKVARSLSPGFEAAMQCTAKQCDPSAPHARSAVRLARAAEAREARA